MIALDHILEDGRLIVWVKRDLLQPGMTLLINADIIFRPEFRPGFRLPSDDGTDIWLAQADDAVLHLMSFVVVHVFLLAIELLDRFIHCKLFVGQIIACFTVFLDISHIAAQSFQISPQICADRLRRLLLRFRQIEIFLPGDPAIGARLLPRLIGLMQSVDHCFELHASFVCKRKVLRITDIHRRYRGIDDRRSKVPVFI